MSNLAAIPEDGAGMVNGGAQAAPFTPMLPYYETIEHTSPSRYIGFDDLAAMCETPSVKQKTLAPAITPFYATNKRKAATEGASYHAIIQDHDDDDLIKDEIRVKYKQFRAGHLAFTSASHQQDKGGIVANRWKVVIPLAEPVGLERYTALAVGMTLLNGTDAAQVRAQQVFFAPNKISEDAPFDYIEALDLEPLDGNDDDHFLVKACLDKFTEYQQAKEKAARQAKPKPRLIAHIPDGEGIIGKMVSQFILSDELQARGYKRCGKTLLSPWSSTGNPGVVIFERDGKEVCYSHHGATDPLSNLNNDGHSLDVVDTLAALDFNGDMAACIAHYAPLVDPDGQKQRQRDHVERESRQKAAQEFEGMGEWWRTSEGQDITFTGSQEVAQNAPELPQESEPDETYSNTAPSLLDALDKYKARHLLDTTPPPQRYVVEGLIPEPVTAAIVAPGSTGKSFWLMQLAACVCSGVPFMGQAIPNPGAVLMLGAEDDRDEMSRRLHSIVHEYRFAGCALDEKAIGERFYAVSRVGESNLLTYMDGRNIVRMDGRNERPDNIGEIVKAAKAIPDLRLIILDPISRFRAGDENDNEAATRFVEALEQIRKETGVTVLCAHHSRKGSDGKDADSIRGASALVDAFRFAATLAKIRSDEAKKMRMDESEVKNLVRFNVVKSNYRTDVDEMWLRRGVGGVLRPTEAPEAIPSGVQVKAEERYTTTLEKLRKLIREKDEAGKPLTRSKLKREYGGTDNVFQIGRDALSGIANRAIEEGKLFVREDGGTLHLY